MHSCICLSPPDRRYLVKRGWATTPFFYSQPTTAKGSAIVKLPINCQRCSSPDNGPSDEFTPVEITDDGIYISLCPNGHQTATILQETKFEVLFTLGSLALKDGYPREALINMA